MSDSQSTPFISVLAKEVIKSCVVALILGYSACVYSNIQANNKRSDDFKRLTIEIKYRLTLTKSLLENSDGFKKAGLNKFSNELMMCGATKYGIEDSDLMTISARISGITEQENYKKFHGLLEKYLLTVKMVSVENNDFPTEHAKIKSYIDTLDSAIEAIKEVEIHGVVRKNIFNPLY